MVKRLESHRREQGGDTEITGRTTESSEEPQKVTTVRIPMTAASLDPFWALGFQIY
jgi:hypothetical protein